MMKSKVLCKRIAILKFQNHIMFRNKFFIHLKPLVKSRKVHFTEIKDLR